MQKILVTGGAGFIGHHFVEHLLKNTDFAITVLDRLNYASTGYDRLRDIEVFDSKRVRVFAADFRLPIVEGLEQELGQFDYIVHMGAETHVDNSIADPRKFVFANVVGTLEMLEFARRQKNLHAFLYFSTDEVFGPAPAGVAYKEWDRYKSSNPYAATKAGGEELAVAYHNTYKLPILITHTMNVFGERQHPEKFIPKAIKCILQGEKLTIHADTTKTKAGSRMWIHARNVSDGILTLLNRKENIFGDKFNIVGEREIDALQMATIIAKIMGKELKYEMVDFHSSRPGHDLRYALDGAKMAKEIGWQPKLDFEASLAKTIQWMIEPNHKHWLGV